MKRRGFLSGILGAGAVARADIDALAKAAQCKGPTYSVPKYSVTLQPPNGAIEGVDPEQEVYEEPLFVTSSWREIFLEDRAGPWAWRPNYSSVRPLADRKVRYRDRYVRRGASLPRVLYRNRHIPTNILEYHQLQQGVQGTLTTIQRETLEFLNSLGGK